MKNISLEELKEILDKHKMWLKGKEGGECASLRGVNLKGANLIGVNLRGANLIDSDLRYADLEDANLEFANLYNANLECAILCNANLECADLNKVNLIDADLSNVNLRGADLNNTNLWNADLNDANLEDVKTNIHTIGYNIACPKEGSFIGYKKANRYIVKLLILEDAKRSSATTCKCRCDKAKVLEIENIKTGERIKEINSNYDISFKYRVGEIVTVDDFDENRWNECTTGIHFFVDKENAINY